MSSIYKFCFIILALSLFTICATFDKAKTMCRDCTEDNKEHCLIEGESGFHRALSYRKLPTKFLRDSNPSNPLTDDLNVCIPSGMTIEAEDGDFHFICVWSPELGCQIIVPKYDAETSCEICRSPSALGKNVGCPCKIPLKRDLGNSGPSELYASSLLITVGYFLCSI
ncbi:uncharacterized protein LOC108046708 [Drosophila rhopaloa]|uniref:Uncharacterized protein LOC108046708 n=1 Tax=Drosophila rhopaloa TaxID=1041015 RepID=A0A6P4EV26_DRORH|nr:uncharacterized protein LOC108046708 [Drosophila rhopaloa]